MQTDGKQMVWFEASTLNGIRYQQLRRFAGVLEYPLDAADPSEAGHRMEDAGRPGVNAR